MFQFYLVVLFGYCINQQVVVCGVECLQQVGYEVVYQQVIFCWQQCFVGIEYEWLVDINQLVQLFGCNWIVFVVCGGYGVSCLLLYIDWQGLVVCQQCDLLLICGYSDFIVIQLGLLVMGNVIIFSGLMFVGNFGVEIFDLFIEYYFWQVLCQLEFIFEWLGEGLNCWVEGILWGGNLVMLILFIGMLWLLVICDGILVVEDINEYLFCVECMLFQLLYSGVLVVQKVVIFGSFIGSVLNDYDVGYDLLQVFDYLCQQLFLLLISGLEFGYEQCMVILLLGVCVCLVNQVVVIILMIGGYLVLIE